MSTLSKAKSPEAAAHAISSAVPSLNAMSAIRRPWEQWRGQAYGQLADLRRQQRQRVLAQTPALMAAIG